MQAIMFKCSFDVLARHDVGESPTKFKVPSAHYHLLMDQFDDLALENIVQCCKSSKEV